VTEPQHPSVEEISDLLAGVLPAAEAMDVNAHLAGCGVCRAERDALLDVTAWLGEEGAVPVVMPPEVSATIDAAIAQASSERANTERASSPGLARPLRWLAGAAAAVVVVAAGIAGLRALPDQGSASDTAGTAAAGQQEQHRQMDSAGKGQKAAPFASGTAPHQAAIAQSFVLHSTAQVAATARRLAANGDGLVAPTAAGCAVPLNPGLVTVVRFQGRPAVLSIGQHTRLATVYDCATATKTLVVTGY
jgi:putative zinc finger protein